MMEREHREKLRDELTRLLTSARDELAISGVTFSAMVTEYIEHYEFGLAYELILHELSERRVQPGDDAAANLRAAASIMGLDAEIQTSPHPPTSS